MATHTLIVDTIERKRSERLVRAVAQCGEFINDEREDAKFNEPTCLDCQKLNKEDARQAALLQHDLDQRKNMDNL